MLQGVTIEHMSSIRIYNDLFSQFFMWLPNRVSNPYRLLYHVIGWIASIYVHNIALLRKYFIDSDLITMRDLYSSNLGSIFTTIASNVQITHFNDVVERIFETHCPFKTR